MVSNARGLGVLLSATVTLLCSRAAPTIDTTSRYNVADSRHNLKKAKKRVSELEQHSHT